MARHIARSKWPRDIDDDQAQRHARPRRRRRSSSSRSRSSAVCDDAVDDRGGASRPTVAAYMRTAMSGVGDGSSCLHPIFPSI